MSKKIASFGATYTTSVDISDNSKPFEETYRIRIGNNTDMIGIYNWDFTYLDDSFDAIVTEISNSTITNMQIMFKYNNSNDGIRISFLKYEGADPKFLSGNSIIGSIQTDELATAYILSTNKNSLTTILDDINSFYYESLLRLASRESITIGIQRHLNLISSSGNLEIGGQNLVGGTSEWRSASIVEPIDAPLLIITYDVTASAHPRLNMKFTTSDPTTNQDIPLNSLGKYIALNDVAPSSPINTSINSTQTIIPIDTSSALPTKIGLGSVGPEIFQYSIIDSDNHQLSSIVRGISPASFPAGFDSFKNAENVYYLHKDSTNNLHLLFDTRPASNLIQYRCVAIANTDSGDDFNIVNGEIGIAQDRNSNSQVVIGVEVPRWDSVSGITVDGSNSTSSTLLVTDNTVLKADNFYDGAFLKITDLTGSVSYTVANSYSSNGVNGEFIISPAVSGLIAGWTFVIMPAPAQQIPNDNTSPLIISERFSGFSENVTSISVSLLDHGTTMQENDLFYVWIKRTLIANAEAKPDTGAVLLFRYRNI